MEGCVRSVCWFVDTFVRRCQSLTTASIGQEPPPQMKEQPDDGRTLYEVSKHVMCHC